jgi:hypothetical protein
MGQISFKELSKLPHFKIENENQMMGRFVLFAPFYENDKWIIPIDINEEIIFTEGTPIRSNYISRILINKDTDVYIPFLDFFYKYASWNDIFYHLNSLTNDIQNLYISIEKIDIFQSIKTNRTDLSELVKTEVEYILIICKSLFDTLQKIISILWNKHIKLLNRNKRNLPETFRKMVYKDKQKLTVDNIIEKYLIPDKLAEYYSGICEFYEALKILRDDIIHHGIDIEDIYVFDNGFAISSKTNLFKSYNIWDDSWKMPNDLYSIRPLLQYWISQSLRACNEFVDVIKQVIKFPPSIMPEHNVYVRTPHLKSYNQMVRELDKGVWWNI